MKQPVKWYQTKRALLLLGVIELALTYIFASLAIDRGALGWYALGFICLFAMLNTCLRLVRKLFHGNKTR